MQLPPLSVLAKYPKPNYVNPETKGPALLVTNCVGLGLSLIVIGIRLYTRLVISHNFGWDDVFILLALVWILGVVAMSAFTYIKFGGTRHVWDVLPTTIPELLKLALATQIVFGNAVTFVKVSMLLLTKRIMGNGSKTLRNIIIFGLVYVVAGNISFTIVMIFQCKPISAQWTLSFTPQDCIDNRAHLISASVINVVSDFLIVLIPIPVVLKLKMRTRQRLVVISLFGAGFAVCAVGIVRTVFAAILTDKSTTDFTWDGHPVYIAGAVELYVGLICASIPPTRAFFSLYTPKLLSLTSASGSTTAGGTSASGSRSKRFFSRDVEKGIHMSDLSNSTKSTQNQNTQVDNEQGKQKPSNNEIRVTIGVDVSRKDSFSDFETSSVEELDRNKSVNKWRSTIGSKGEPMVKRVESQTNLIQNPIGGGGSGSGGR